MNQKRSGTSRPSLSEQLMDLTERSRWLKTKERHYVTKNAVCVGIDVIT